MILGPEAPPRHRPNLNVLPFGLGPGWFSNNTSIFTGTLQTGPWIDILARMSIPAFPFPSHALGRVPVDCGSLSSRVRNRLNMQDVFLPFELSSVEDNAWSRDAMFGVLIDLLVSDLPLPFPNGIYSPYLWSVTNDACPM